MVFVSSEKEPLLRASVGLSRRASVRFAACAVTALMVVCFAALTVLEEHTPRPSALIPSSDIETQPGQLGGADPYNPRRFSPYVSLSAPELLNAQEKLHQKELDFFLKSQRDAGFVPQQPGLELSENSQAEPEVSAPRWVSFPKHRNRLAHKLQRLAGTRKIDPLIKRAAVMLDSAAKLRNDPVFREAGRYDGASVMDNKRVRLALQKIASRLGDFDHRAAAEQRALSVSLDHVGNKLRLRVRRDKDLIVSSTFYCCNAALPFLPSVWLHSYFLFRIKYSMPHMRLSEI